jgi:methylase of polypeptide subunit release factors
MTLPGVDPAATDDYRSRVAARLAGGDAPVTEAFDDWRAYVRRHHGAVFDDDHADTTGSDAETTAPRDLFCDTLAFDAAVRALRRTIEATFGLRTDEPTDPLDLSSAHGAIDASVVDLDASGTGTGDHDGTTARAVDPATLLAVDADDLRRLYERTVPAASRRVFGEYYTPPGLAELGVEAAAAGVDDFSSARVVDPGCGAGAFLTAALRRKRGDVSASDASVTAVESVDWLTTTVVGVDVNPVAVAAARTAYLLELLPILHENDVGRVPLPVFLGDALGLVDDAPTTGVEGAATVLLGNPPWIPWERLPDAQKRRLREGPVERLGLFDHEGATARLGHANDDLSLPFVWTCLDRYLDDGGVAAFVLKRDHLGGPAGRLLRSGRVGPRPLSIEHVHDFAAVDPFDDVDAAAALYLFRVGGSDCDPEDATGIAPEAVSVPATAWEPTDGVADFGSLAALRATLARTETGLRPVDPDDRAGPWHRTDAAVDALGDCVYRIRHGLKDDAKAVFSVDSDRLAELESTHVYPYLRSKHVVKWGLFGHDRFLVPQRQAGADNERALARESPATYDYLTDHRERLEARGSSWFEAGPFYSLFGLGPYTWAPYKVVWCRLGFKPHFAVVSTVDDPELGEKTVVPGDHCMFVARDDEREAHYLCALLNAAPYQRCLRDLAGGGKAGLSKSVVSSVALPAWEDTDRQSRLADLSLRAHAIVPNYTDCSKRAYNDRSIPELAAVEREIDAVATRFLEAR